MYSNRSGTMTESGRSLDDCYKDIERQEEWQVKARREQQEFNKVLGTRKWNEIERTDLFNLRKRIGFAIFGPPNKSPTPIDFFGYTRCEFLENDEIRVIYKVLWTLFHICTTDRIRVSYIMLVIYNYGGNSLTTPVFKTECVRDNITKEILIDRYARVYQSWTDFVKSNRFTLPECFYCFPARGRYDSQNEIDVEFHYSSACDLPKPKPLTGFKKGMAFTALCTFGVITAPLSVPITLSAALPYAVVTAGAGVVGTITNSLVSLYKGKDKVEVVPDPIVNGIKAIDQPSEFGKDFVDITKFDIAYHCPSFSGGLYMVNLSYKLLFFHNVISYAKSTYSLLNQMAEMKEKPRPSFDLPVANTVGRNKQAYINKEARLRGYIKNMFESSVITMPLTSQHYFARLIFTMLDNFPYVQGLLHVVQSMGVNVISWFSESIFPLNFNIFVDRDFQNHLPDLMISLDRDIQNLREQYTEFADILQRCYGNLRDQSNNLFPITAAQETVYYASLLNVENEIYAAMEFVDGQINESHPHIYNNDSEEDPKGKFEFNMQLLITEVIEFIRQFRVPVQNLIQFNHLITSYKDILIEEYLNSYERSFLAAEQGNNAFNLTSFHSSNGYEENCGRQFFRNALRGTNCERVKEKILSLYTKRSRTGDIICTNILYGSENEFSEYPFYGSKREVKENVALHPFYGSEGSGVMLYEDLLTIINKVIKFGSLKRDLVSIEEKNNVIFIYPNLVKERYKRIVIVYHYLDKNNTTCGLITVFYMKSRQLFGLLPFPQ